VFGYGEIMERDDDVAARMLKIRERQQELEREREEVMHFARQDLAKLDAAIDEMKSRLDDLYSQRRDLHSILGMSQSSVVEKPRLAHGELRDLCFEALRTTSKRMKSGEIRDWIARKYPSVRVSSVPATMSHQAELGAVMRDERGYYWLT
jgi:uncharacterized protein (DUF3084 family)